MEEEFSLSQYVTMLRRRWRTVAVVLGVALLAAAAFSLFQPVSYDAQAVLVAQAPKYAWRLDSSFQSIVEDLRLDRRSDYTALISDKALGSQMARQVIILLGDKLPPDLQDVQTVRRSVEVKNGAGRLLYLLTNAPTPDLARDLTDAWSQVLIAEVEARFGQSADRTKFEAELAGAQAHLDQVTQALRDFQARTGLAMELGGEMTTLSEGTLAAGLPLLQQKLVLGNSALAEYQVASERVQLLIDRAKAAQAAGAGFGTLPLEVLSTPLLVERGQVTRAKIDALGGNFDRLLVLLDAEQEALSETLATLQVGINALQAELADKLQERNRLQREYNISEEAVKALERKVTELSIQEGVSGSMLAVASPAGLPETKATPNWIINLGLAFVLGLLGGVALALGRAYVRGA